MWYIHFESLLIWISSVFSLRVRNVKLILSTLYTSCSSILFIFPYAVSLSPASVQCHRCGSPHEAAAAWQQHGQQHGRLQPSEQAEPDTQDGPESGPGWPDSASSEPKHRPGSQEPEHQLSCWQTFVSGQQLNSSTQGMWVSDNLISGTTRTKEQSYIQHVQVAYVFLSLTSQQKIIAVSYFPCILNN